MFHPFPDLPIDNKPSGGRPHTEAPDSMTTPYLSVTALLTTVVLVSGMLVTIAFTYTTCVLEKNCPALPHLPTISNTWTHIPGNFLSRYVVSTLSLGLGIMQLPIWLPQIGKISHAKLFMGMGIFAVFCLSWVGAICDDGKNPECRGNNSIHTTCAVTFFVLYNVNMVVLAHHDKRRRWLAPTLALACIAPRCAGWVSGRGGLGASRG